MERCQAHSRGVPRTERAIQSIIYALRIAAARCVSAVGSLSPVRNGVDENTRFFYRKPVYLMTGRQYRAQADDDGLPERDVA